MQKKGAALRGLQEEGLGGGPGSGPGVRRAGEAPPARLDFAPVPRRYRHDGWTPERQKAFIEALADTGCVTRAAHMVNMSQPNAYTLRRSPGAEEFRRAWDAALDFGLKRLKDIAFERAIEGYLVPVFVGGKLMGFRRKHNDALLMFCLRHFGGEEGSKRTTVNYVSTRASAGAAAAGPGHGHSQAGAASAAEASATTVRTVVSGSPGGGGALRDDRSAQLLNGFEGVQLDPQAAADIAAALEACAARERALREALNADGEAALDAGLADATMPFVRIYATHNPIRGPLESPAPWVEAPAPFVKGEDDWQQAGAEMPAELAYWRDRAAAVEAAWEAEGAAAARGEAGEAVREEKDPSAHNLHTRRTRGAKRSGRRQADEQHGE